MLRRNVLVIGFCLPLVLAGSVSAGVVSGELKVWHKVTLAIDGPESSEQATPNPFTDYRLDAAFIGPSGQAYTVPGYFATDGNAANTGADAGNQWRVHFTPDEPGQWTYKILFRAGGNVAVSDDLAAGEPVEGIDGQTGTFTVVPTDKTGWDFRGKGMLRYVGQHYLQFAGNGEYFLKCGADAPENFLAYVDFDGPFKSDGVKDELIKTWQPHVKDWTEGDPTWGDGKGKGMIGALNYLASEGLNAFSFLTMNINGDDRNVFPYTDYEERYRMDVSKLAQWEIVFAHADTLGLFLHFKTQETENDRLLDGGELGPQRILYYRELIARFGHHLALNWNLGEETTNTTKQLLDFCGYFNRHDPYKHPVVVHTYPDQKEKVYQPLLGKTPGLRGVSLQTDRADFGNVHRDVLKWIQQSEKAGVPWVVACDEPGDPQHALVPDKDNPEHDNARMNGLWGAVMAGGAGLEWYFGYGHDHSDLTCQDFRSRDAFWDQCRTMLDFFEKQKIPFCEMKSADDLTWQKDDYCFIKDGEIYLIYQKQGGLLMLDLQGGATYSSGYFNPRTGEGASDLLNKQLMKFDIKNQTYFRTFKAPDAKDWLLVIRTNGGKVSQTEKTPPPNAANTSVSNESLYQGQIFEKKDGLLTVEAELFSEQSRTDKRQWYVTTAENVPDGDPVHLENASGGAYLEILPDTRRSEADPLVVGENFMNDPGQMAVLSYPVTIHTPGRYYVWVRAYSTGTDDNGLHVGVDGTWPESGQRLQWCDGKNSWRWESKQRTEENHCGEPYKIYLDIDQPGPHTIQFSMREDGFEFDTFILTQDREFQPPN